MSLSEQLRLGRTYTREFLGHTHNDRLVPYSVKVKRKSLTQRSFPALLLSCVPLAGTLGGKYNSLENVCITLRPHSFQFIQTEPTCGLTGVYTIVNSFMSPVSLSMSNYTISGRICQEKTFSKRNFFKRLSVNPAIIAPAVLPVVFSRASINSFNHLTQLSLQGCQGFVKENRTFICNYFAFILLDIYLAP